MKFVIGYAGIPSAIYDDVLKQMGHICTRDPNCEFISIPLVIRDGAANQYSLSHANYFLKEFQRRLSQDVHSNLSDTGFAIICVDHDRQSTVKFIDSFFPSVLVSSVAWELDRSNKHSIAQSKNRLVEILWGVTNNVKRSIPAVKKEITEHDNKTPLLLPIKNFDSKHLVPLLKEIQKTLVAAENKMETLKSFINTIEYYHPRKLIRTNNKPCFVDDRDIEFHPPGSARHAFARISNVDHLLTCLLAGKRRLGAPYHPAFHYDCESGHGGNLKGCFSGCHEKASIMTGSPHLNIAPNDFIR